MSLCNPSVINILAWGFMFTYIFMSQKRISQKNISLLPKKMCFTFVTWYILALLLCNKRTQPCLYPNNTNNHLEIFQRDSHLNSRHKKFVSKWIQNLSDLLEEGQHFKTGGRKKKRVTFVAQTRTIVQTLAGRLLSERTEEC